MKIIYKSILVQISKARRDAEMVNREIDYIVLSDKEAEQLKAELHPCYAGPESYGTAYGTLPANVKVFGIDIRIN